MKTKILYGTFLGLFLALCLTFSVGMLIFGPSQPGSNEQLAQQPSLKLEDGKPNWDYLSQLTAWINDRFFLRQELISTSNFLSSNLLFSSGKDDVIRGSQGWLYYADTLPDYTGTGLMSQRELYSAANNVALMAQYCREQGIRFAFTVAPNKNSLYPQFMPNVGVTAQTSNAELLQALLAQKQVPYVDLFTGFRNQDEILYFAHDSHWNAKGAALGADLINEAFGRESAYFQGDFSVTEYHDGDLYAMVYPGFLDYELHGVFNGLTYGFQGSQTDPNSINLTTVGSGEGSLLAYRDSFGILLFPYLADSFANARFSRSTTYNLTGDYDCILIELVERNIRYLIENIPVMPAPTVQLQLQQTAEGGTASAEITAKTALKDHVLIQGTLPTEADTDSGIYILCEGKTYEAFALANGRYAAYIPQEEAVTGLSYLASGSQLVFNFQ